MPYLTSAELVEATGATKRQVNYWVKSGVIPLARTDRSGSGYNHLFDPAIIPRVKNLVKVSTAFQGKVNSDILKRVYNDFREGKVRISSSVYLIVTTDG
jgi:hypothetical protein